MTVWPKLPVSLQKQHLRIIMVKLPPHRRRTSFLTTTKNARAPHLIMFYNNMYIQVTKKYINLHFASSQHVLFDTLTTICRPRLFIFLLSNDPFHYSYLRGRHTQKKWQAPLLLLSDSECQVSLYWLLLLDYLSCLFNHFSTSFHFFLSSFSFPNKISVFL